MATYGGNVLREDSNFVLRENGFIVLREGIEPPPTVIDTVTYSQHPVNCQMAGNEPLSKVKHRITEWSDTVGKVTTKSKFKSGTVWPVGSTKL